jgi:hypothetical protein
MLSRQARNECLAKHRPLLIGDSHLRVLHQSVAHDAVHLHMVKGVYNASHGPNYWTDMNEAPARTAALRPWLESTEGREEMQRAKVVYFEAGHWDLRDWSVAQFVADVTEALNAWPVVPGQRRVLVTAPSYSYAMHSYGMREYRTLEKLEEANARLVALFGERGWHVAHLWALSRPLYRATCDTHHFLCPGSNRHSPVGLAFLEAFYHQLCTSLA